MVRSLPGVVSAWPLAGRKDDERVHRIRQCAECGSDYPTAEGLDYEAFTRMLTRRRATLAGVGFEARRVEAVLEEVRWLLTKMTPAELLERLRKTAQR